MLAYPGGRLASLGGARRRRALPLAGAVLVLGLLPALFFDPATFGCVQCPDNLLLVADEPGLVDDLNRLGVHLGLAWSLLLIAVAAWRVARSSRTRRRVVAPVVLAGCVYLGLVAATFATSLDRGFVGSGELERRLWLAQAAALAALAAAVAWGLLRARRTRSSLARLVVELGESAPPAACGTGSPRRWPTRSSSSPTRSARAATRTRAGGRSTPLRSDGRAATPLVRDGRPVAVLLHRADLLDNPELIEEVASAARLALENERLQAEARAQLEDLRSSRARIVEAGDAERRRLERDLHDGAQQRLVGLSLALRLLRGQLGATTRELAARLDEAEAELGRAVAELRELAHGIHPAVLSDEGLAAAIEALAEDARRRCASSPCRRSGSPRPSRPRRTSSSPRPRRPAPSRVSAAAGATARSSSTSRRKPSPRGSSTWRTASARWTGASAVERAAGGGVRIRAEIPCG